MNMFFLKVEKKFAIEVWHFLTSLTLNFEYIGHLDPSCWPDVSSPSDLQIRGSQKLLEQVSRFIDDSVAGLPSIMVESWPDELKKANVDYNFEETCSARPLRAHELAPGLPDEGVAGSVTADK